MDEIESDMSAVHRIDDLNSMPSKRFFKFVSHLVAYKGAVRLRVEKEQDDRENGRHYQAPVTDTRNWKKAKGKSVQPTGNRSPVKPGAASSRSQGGESRTEFKDPSLNPSLTSVQPGQRVPFMEKGSPS